jgi:hypothetical protein
MKTTHAVPLTTPITATFTVTSCGEGRGEILIYHEEAVRASSYGCPGFYASTAEARQFAAELLAACDAADAPRAD